MRFIDFRYEYLGYTYAFDAFRLIKDNFYYSPQYLDESSIALAEIHSMTGGIIYGCNLSTHRHKITVSEGLVDCGGKIAVRQSKIGVRRNTDGFLIITPDKRFRVVSSLPTTTHVCFARVTSSGSNLILDESCRDQSVQLMHRTVSGSIEGIEVDEGVTRIYTIDHSDEAVFSIPSYVTIEIDEGFVAEFIEDSQSPGTMQISVIQADQGAPAATLQFTRSGLSSFLNWYYEPIT